MNELAYDWIVAGVSGQQGLYTFCLLVGVSGVTAGKAFEFAEAAHWEVDHCTVRRSSWQCPVS